MSTMKTLTKIYYGFLIIFRIPTYVIHEFLHLIPAVLFKTSPKLSMNFDFSKGTSSPCVDYVFTGFRYKEFIISASPVLGILIPVFLSFITFSTIAIGFTLYQFINFKFAFLSPTDINIIKNFESIKSKYNESCEDSN